MLDKAQGLDSQELEAAFALFAEASRQLSDSYAELQGQVVSLTRQLELANGKLQQELEEKERLSQRLTLLLGQLPGGVLEITPDGLVGLMNRAAERMLPGLRTEMCFTDWFQANLQPCEQLDLWMLNGAQGDARYYSLLDAQLPAAGGKLVLLQDMTDHQRMQQKLERQERLAAMGEMAAGLAHQLRTPLAAALLHVGNLQRPGLAEEARSRLVARTGERLRHLEELVKNMLVFVRGQQTELQEVALAGVVDDAVKHVQAQLDLHQMTCHVELEQNGFVRASRQELTGVLVNLLENAMQFSPAGACVELRVEKLGSRMQIVVQDEGCGIDAAILPKLFDPFFTTRKEGTGLGLAIVRNLIEGWGGEVWVQSEPGRGSSFGICLPITKEMPKL